MITGTMRYKKNFDRITMRIEKDLQSNCKKATKDTAEAIMEYIKDNWSPAPSGKNEPPAVRDGTLDRGISVEEQGRSRGGRFEAKGADSALHFVVFDTGAAGRGQYALAVNDGNSISNAAPRPFLEPAVKAKEATYIENLKHRNKNLKG